MSRAVCMRLDRGFLGCAVRLAQHVALEIYERTLATRAAALGVAVDAVEYRPRSLEVVALFWRYPDARVAPNACAEVNGCACPHQPTAFCSSAISARAITSPASRSSRTSSARSAPLSAPSAIATV